MIGDVRNIIIIIIIIISQHLPIIWTKRAYQVCPAGYDYKEGDIQGWGQLKGRINTTMEGCSDECNNQADCCSFEYSFSSGLCNLNKDCEPSLGKYKDYHFCRKVCPAGYDYKEGDIQGWGQLKGRINTTMEGCSDDCSNQ